jgi:AcrR family transcriptional regulator
MQAEQRKKQILRAALKAFAEYGYERTSIAVICQKADIARPTLYQYFKDKRSLFRELLESYLPYLNQKIHARQQEKDRGKKLSDRETLRSLQLELLDELANHRDFFIIFFKEAKARNAETEDIVWGIMQGIKEEFVAELRIHPSSKGVSDEDLEFTVLYTIGGMMQIVEYYLFDNSEKLTNEQIADKIADIEAAIYGI